MRDFSVAVLTGYLVINDGSSMQGLVYAKGSLVRHTKHEARVRPCSETGLHSDSPALDVLKRHGPPTVDQQPVG